MRDPNRIAPMVAELAAIWAQHPDWRLGQLISNAVSETGRRIECDPFYIEDDELLEGIRAFNRSVA